MIFSGGEEGGGRRERKRRDKNGRRGKRKRKKKTNIFEGLAYESLLNLFPFSGEKIYSEKLKKIVQSQICWSVAETGFKFSPL